MGCARTIGKLITRDTQKNEESEKPESGGVGLILLFVRSNKKGTSSSDFQGNSGIG